ncbi:MAG: hypothetical protein HO274_02445 [Ferrovum myxofaciens]|uniref:restriction endonuclease subunit S n=1 Tax=Ferrovum myxofaciens TaxID=416213 RepID=UPI002352154E|nr:restriction endonuclease subunit S [Ferrovum myxofaciens]QKE40314.1 MAG: hypothetical protein HO274_02445 [Ferrovum myxofaciens]
MSDPMNVQPRHQYGAFLKQLPDDWEQKEITQIGAVVGGGTPSREVPSFWRGSIPWATPGEVSGEDAKLLHDTNDHISASGLAGSGANLLSAGSLLVTTRATLGARVINAVPMATNQGFKSIVFKRPEEASYYFHLLEKVKPELVRRASGTTFLEISAAEFGSIKVPSPSPNEKQKISQILDTLDTAIHETDVVIAKLKAVKQGMLHDLLTRGIAANNELRPPQAEAPHLYKESPLGWIPKEWGAVTLSACSLKIADRDHTTPRYIEDGVLIVSPTNLLDDEGIDFVSSKRISRRAHEINCKKTDLAPGDIVLHRIGAGLGRVRLVTAEMPEFSILHSMAQIRPNLNAMTSHFMLWAMRAESTKNQMGLGTQSIGVPDLGLDKISNFIVPKPPLEEQRQIAERLVALQTRIDADSNDYAKLVTLKSGLMDDLLTGRVRVTPLLAEAAQQHGSA